jgi:hypothetical protein
MKLRLKGNSIRLRLTQGEVERLVSEGIVQETVEFGPGMRSFTFALGTAADAGGIRAEYENDRLRVLLPAPRAREWADSEEIGVEADLDGLRVLIEKDFACLKPRPGEDESDMFPNPDQDSCQPE